MCTTGSDPAVHSGRGERLLAAAITIVQVFGNTPEGVEGCKPAST